MLKIADGDVGSDVGFLDLFEYHHPRPSQAPLRLRAAPVEKLLKHHHGPGRIDAERCVWRLPTCHRFGKGVAKDKLTVIVDSLLPGFLVSSTRELRAGQRQADASMHGDQQRKILVAGGPWRRPRDIFKMILGDSNLPAISRDSTSQHPYPKSYQPSGPASGAARHYKLCRVHGSQRLRRERERQQSDGDTVVVGYTSRVRLRRRVQRVAFATPDHAPEEQRRHYARALADNDESRRKNGHALVEEITSRPGGRCQGATASLELHPTNAVVYCKDVDRDPER